MADNHDDVTHILELAADHGLVSALVIGVDGDGKVKVFTPTADRDELRDLFSQASEELSL